MITKAIVETVGDHMYIDTHTGFVIESDRPVVTQVTPFLSQKIADGHIKLLTPNLPADADDAEFAKYIAEFKDADNGKNAAVAAFASKFNLDESGNATTAKESKKKETKETAKEPAKEPEKTQEELDNEANDAKVLATVTSKPKK